MTSLSNSSLWRSMEDYYKHMGPEAWSDEVVPFQITNNLVLAKIYTQLIIAQINDYLNHTGKSSVSEPFHIIEIGSGSGKFSFYLIKMLTAALKVYNLPANTILYIMTDICKKNIDSWQQHPNLQPYIESGCLDFAYYDATKDQIIQTTNKTIEPNSLTKPIFVICNYLIDTLPHDAFQVINNKLYEIELIIQNSNPNSNTVDQYFNNVSYKFKKNPIGQNYYQDPKLNSILSFYQDHFENASFLLPVGGIQLLNNISKLTTSHANLLVADKGITDLSLFDNTENPDISLHGSVSMSVNFDALDRYAKSHGGTSLLMPNKGGDFQLACFNLNSCFPIPNTNFAFNTVLSAFSPCDLYNLCYKEDSPNLALASLEDLLILLNIAEWDPNIFYDYHSLLLERLEQEEISEEQKLTLMLGLDKIWEYFFKLEKTQDVPFAIGMLLYTIDEPGKALIFYRHSLALFGEQEETRYNLELAEQLLKDNANEVALADQTIKLIAEQESA